MKGPTKLQMHPSKNAVTAELSKNEANATSPVDNNLLTKAVVALVKHHNQTVKQTHQQSNTTPLLGTDVAIHVQLTLARVPERTSYKPIRLDLPHSIFLPQSGDDDNNNDNNLEPIDVCLIVKDEAKQGIQDLIESMPKHKALAQIRKVLTLSSLRKKYGRFADRRELLARFDLFMADDRILPMLGRALGKNFFEKKKQPIPIRVTHTKHLPFLVDTCLKSTFVFIRPGTCLSIKAGYTQMATTKLTENIQSVITHVVPHIPRRWNNIMSISIKTHHSVALPIYNKTREELQLLANLVDDGDIMETSDMTEKPKKKRSLDTEESITASKHTARDILHNPTIVSKSPLIQALKKQRKETDVSKSVPTPPTESIKVVAVKKSLEEQKIPRGKTTETMGNKNKLETSKEEKTKVAATGPGKEATQASSKPLKRPISDEAALEEKKSTRVKTTETMGNKNKLETSKEEKKKVAATGPGKEATQAYSNPLKKPISDEAALEEKKSTRVKTTETMGNKNKLETSKEEKKKVAATGPGKEATQAYSNPLKRPISDEAALEEKKSTRVKTTETMDNKNKLETSKEEKKKVTATESGKEATQASSKPLKKPISDEAALEEKKSTKVKTTENTDNKNKLETSKEEKKKVTATESGKEATQAPSNPLKEAALEEKKSTRVKTTENMDNKNKLETSKEEKKKVTATGPGKEATQAYSNHLKKPVSDEAALSDAFLGAKKFIGAKKGYVFRQGPKGLGYYKDIVPKVDEIALKKFVRGKRG